MESVFRTVFGASPLVRVIDFFLDNQEFSYSMADMIREEGISFTTVKPIWSRLVSIGVLVETSKAGKARLYALNTTHPLVERLRLLDDMLVEYNLLV